MILWSRPERSPLSRVDARVKLLALAVLGGVALSAENAFAQTLLLAFSFVALGLAGVRRRHLKEILYAASLALVVGAFSAAGARPADGLVTAMRIATTMFFALAFVLSTSVQAMLFAFTRLLAPLERAGLRPRVIAGTCALCMKLVGFVFAQWRLTSEAFVSRGVRPRVSRVVPHVVVATLHHADAVAEALIARGLNVGELHHGKRPDA